MAMKIDISIPVMKGTKQIFKRSRDNCSFTDALTELNNQLPFKKLHCFIIATQTSYFEKVRNNIGNTEMIFPENFANSAGSQDEIQCVHCTYPQIDIFTCFSWLKDISVHPFLLSK